MFVSAEPHDRVTLALGDLISAASIFCRPNPTGKNAMPYNSHSISLPSDLFSLALHPNRPFLATGLSSGHLRTYTWPYSEDGDNHDDSDGGVEEDPTIRGDGGFRILWKTRRHKGSCRCVAFSGDGDGEFIPRLVVQN